MNRYESYKETGVQWIGEIPRHWGISRLKFLSNKLRSGGTPKADNSNFYTDESGTPWVAIADMSTVDFVKETEKHLTEAGLKDKNLQIYPAGTLLYSIYATLGKVAELSIPAAINQAILAISLKKNYLQSFCKYVLKAQEKFVIGLASTNTQANLNAEKVSNYYMPVPPLEEQKAIADFLDAKTAELDEEKQNCLKQIELLKELKQSIILNAVMHGLHKDVEMKDSECDWLGLIPKSWSVKAYKYCMEIENGKDYKEVVSEEGYPVMGSGGQFAHASSYLYDGEAVLLGRKGTIDKPLYYKGKFWSVDTMFYAHPKGKNFCKFMYYAALCFPFDKYSTATALPSMTQTDLGNHKIAVPPVEEQKCIADYLDVKTAAVDEQIQLQEQQIKLIDELKQSIISQAVTGKIKVF